MQAFFWGQQEVLSGEEVHVWDMSDHWEILPNILDLSCIAPHPVNEPPVLPNVHIILDPDHFPDVTAY
jgi:hypothetical protein